MKIRKASVAVLFAITAITPLAFGAEKDMNLGAFTKIQVNASVDMDVSVGKKSFFTMKGRDEDLEKLIIEVKGDTLVIKKKRNSGSIRQVDITLGMNDLTNFTINGSSDVKINDVDTDSFDLHINGSGDVTMTGKSDQLNVKINGSGDVSSDRFDSHVVKIDINGSGDVALSGKCDELTTSFSGSGDFAGRKFTCADVQARISGSGDAIFYARNSLDVSSSGNADIEVYGNPKSIKSRSSGSSDLIVHEDK